MVLAIGRELIESEIENAALRGILDSTRYLDGTYPNWPEMVRELLESPLGPTAQERISLLQTAIHKATSGDDLIRVLYREVLERED